MTQLPASLQPRWDRSGWLEIGRALLAASEDNMTAGELARATHRDSSNVRRDAENMCEGQLLRKEKASARRSARGPDAAVAYALTDEAREALMAKLEQQSFGEMAAGTQLVYAEATGGRLRDLFGVMSDPELTSQVMWSALADGDRQEYVLAFAGGEAVRLALALMAALEAVDVPCRRTTISGVWRGHELREAAQRSLRAAQKGRAAAPVAPAVRTGTGRRSRVRSAEPGE